MSTYPELPLELSRLVSTFLADLTAPKHSKPISSDQLSSIFQDFYESFEDKAELFVKGSLHLTKVELLTKEEQQEKNKEAAKQEIKIRSYVESAEAQVTSKVFERLFNKYEEDVSINNYINAKITALQKVKGIDYNRFIDLDGIDLSDPSFATVSHCLSKLSLCKAPRSKIDIILDVHSQINQLVKTQLSIQTVSGDYLLPLFIYIVLIHQEHTDLYLHFLFISRFRNAKYLTAEPLYSLTNFEAALSYTNTLILTQESLDFSQLSDDEYLLLSQQQTTTLPIHNIVQPTPLPTDGIRSFGNALDNSLKTLVKFGADSAETGYAPLKGLASVIKWRSTSTPSTPVPTTEIPSTPQTQVPDLEKFSGKDFDQLTIADLKQVWKDYNSLVAVVKTKKV